METKALGPRIESFVETTLDYMVCCLSSGSEQLKLMYGFIGQCGLHHYERLERYDSNHSCGSKDVRSLYLE
jgi:hypothetical protein